MRIILSKTNQLFQFRVRLSCLVSCLSCMILLSSSSLIIPAYSFSATLLPSSSYTLSSPTGRRRTVSFFLKDSTPATTAKAKAKVASIQRCSAIFATNDNDNDNDDNDTTMDKNNQKKKGDTLRSATGIRPSLHPITINCISEALLLRSSNSNSKSNPNSNESNNAIDAIDIADPSTPPLQIAINAGTIALNAINQRIIAATIDNEANQDGVLTQEESQTVSGRVVGVIMRMRELEQLLIQNVCASKKDWVVKYGEQESFGVLLSEIVHHRREDATGKNKEELENELSQKIKLDPLFRMNRAECLLALFLKTVEEPTLEKIGQSVSGGSGVDFIDGDRAEVLLVAVADS